MQEQEQIQQQSSEEYQCPICLQILIRPVQLRTCQHLFCDSCLDQIITLSNDFRCPLCRTTFVQQDIRAQGELWQHLKASFGEEIEIREEFLKNQQNERIKVSMIIGNTTEEIQTESSNKYRWQLFIRSVPDKQPINKYAKIVQVQLDPTFPHRIERFNLKYEKEPITVQRVGWGTFRVIVKLHWSEEYNQKCTEVFHDLEFIPYTQNTVHTYLTRRKNKPEEKPLKKVVKKGGKKGGESKKKIWY